MWNKMGFSMLDTISAVKFCVEYLMVDQLSAARRNGTRWAQCMFPLPAQCKSSPVQLTPK